jgi:maltose alpha-D-glucosyltransferase / alpha-amylase
MAHRCAAEPGGEDRYRRVSPPQLSMKLYRRVRQGIQPELEVSRFLREVAHYPTAPALLGLVEHVAPDGPSGNAMIAE